MTDRQSNRCASVFARSGRDREAALRGRGHL
jgi:hypothetical protein